MNLGGGGRGCTAAHGAPHLLSELEHAPLPLCPHAAGPAPQARPNSMPRKCHRPLTGMAICFSPGG